MRKAAELKATALTDAQIARLRCDACGQRMLRRTTRRHEYEVKHDGREAVKIVIPDLEVVECGNPACDPASAEHAVIWDGDATWRVTVEGYRQLGLLTPDEIRAGRERLGLTQQQLQELLGLGGNTLSRWESGRVFQSRSSDTLLRIAFEVPEAVLFLRRGPIEPRRTVAAGC